jgi:hypothetical protein
MLKNNVSKKIDSYCEHMRYVLDKYEIIEFDIVARCFSVDLLVGMRKKLWFCPWCGTKFSNDLDNEWMKVLREEYNIKDPIFDDADKVPAEFRTDEWWRKRNL